MKEVDYQCNRREIRGKGRGAWIFEDSAIKMEKRCEFDNWR